MPEKKIKLIFVVNDFLVGGVQRQLSRQLRYYNRDVFDIELITLFQFPGKATLYENVPTDILVHRVSFSSFRDIKSWVGLFRLLQKLKPDVVISSLYFSNTVTRILSLFLRYKTIAREHNTYLKKTKLQILVDRILFYCTDRLVCVSETVKAFTVEQEHLDAKKVFVIYNGIDLEEIHTSQKTSPLLPESFFEQRNIEKNKKIILNVARLTTQKNHTLLFEAFKLFEQRHPEYILVVLGEGYLLETLQGRIRELGLESKVFLMGNQQNVESYYVSAQFFVSTSLMEGLSNAYLEALAFGLPLVTTKTAGTDEFIKEGVNGFFIESFTVAAVETALEKMVITLSQNNNLKTQAMESVQPFDVKKIVQQYQEFILTLLKK